MLRVAASAAIVAAAVLGYGNAWSACPAGQSRHCVNLDLVPQISQRIAADQGIAAAPAKPLRQAEPKAPYSGPIVGLSPTVRPTPTVGYRWKLD